MTIKTIIWDIGGVLERTEDRSYRNQLAKQLNYEPGALEDLFFGKTDNHRLQFGVIHMPEHQRNIARTLGKTPEEIADYFETFFLGDRLDTDLVDYIRSLKKDHTTAVLSNYSTRLRTKINQLWEIADAFDHIIISAEVGMMKPDPAIYHLALERTESLPSEAVFIDDSPENIVSAQAVGMHAVQFTTPQAAIQQLQDLLGK